ncbi:MAG: hypothetical protein ABR972_15145 [Acidimicrobiales bacterium]|jgi:hypothetical protein
MTTYEVESEDDGHHLLASWPDLPERASHPVATFQELKLATVAKSVLSAASRYRWRRWVDLANNGVLASRSREPEGASLPTLPTSAVLGDPPMSAELEQRIEALIPAPGQEPEPVSVDSSGFAERVRFGNLRPLLWRDWCGHLDADEHDALSAELDADLASTTGPLTGRARQAAWYLSAELLIDEDHSKLAPKPKGGRDEESTKALQESLVRLLSDLTGLRVESTAVDWDPDNEELLRVHSPVAVVGFWLDQECWYYGWPDLSSQEGRPTVWQHAGTLPTDTSIGDLAGFIIERTAARAWPFGGRPPSEKRGLFGGLR